MGAGEEAVTLPTNNAEDSNNTGKGAIGVGVGIAVATVGPSAAMGLATTFGVASTGTAISLLSGAAATNAALAWLGGGALIAGGGGMAAGNAVIAALGPIGWGIAGVALIGSGIMLLVTNDERKILENVYTRIGERGIRSYKLALVEMNERIKRIDEESRKLEKEIGRISTFGLDYDAMSEEQQYELGSYVNLMTASTQLLVNPILGLQPKINEKIYDEYCKDNYIPEIYRPEKKIVDFIIYLGNLLYGAGLTEKEKNHSGNR